MRVRESLAATTICLPSLPLSPNCHHVHRHDIHHTQEQDQSYENYPDHLGHHRK